MSHGIARGTLDMLQEVLGGACDLLVRFLSHRSGVLSGYLENGVRHLNIQYGNHESSQVASKQVYEWILDS